MHDDLRNEPKRCWHIPVFARLFAIIVLLVSSSGLASQVQSVNRDLDAIDSRDFLRVIASPASGPEAVKTFVADAPEVKYLITHARESIPIMLQRFKDPSGFHSDQTRVTYFIIFEKTKDRRVLLTLADYLDSVPDNEQSAVVSGSKGILDPFEYALDAAQAFGGMSVLPQKSSPTQIFQARHEIAARLRQESTQGSKATDESRAK